MRTAIAGGGIAGLTAALALARHGLESTVYERAAHAREVGAGIQLSPNAVHVLRALGLERPVLERASAPEAIEIRDSGGRLLARIPLGRTACERFGAPYLVIHRGDLHEILLAHADGGPLVSLWTGTPLSEVSAGGDGGIGFLAGGERREADLLICADGVHSAARTEHFGHSGALATGAVAWRATLPRRDVPKAIAMTATGLWLAAGLHVVHYPVRGGEELNVVAIAGAEQAGERPPPAGAAAPLRDLLAAIPDWLVWPLLRVNEARGWTRGRAVLIGDAAHAMPPTAAQGGAQAIEDGWELACALAAARSDPAAALTAWERARRPRVERICREARRNLALYRLGGAAALARNLAIAALPGRLHLARLDWLYSRRPTNT
ncbi:FAD-dependent monooxygenase [Faunimonas sp. B44]|uniref:FAD-dependent monooxygenase n=1 Tax=Faunimonas sp. B44 TaxID=3461493 RepID=UPI004043FA6A